MAWLLLGLGLGLGWQLVPYSATAIGTTSTEQTIESPAVPHFANSTEQARAYFSPNGGAKEATLAVINSASQDIAVAMFCFTDPDYADALIAAKRRGVAVSVRLDGKKAREKYCQSRRLIAAGIAVEFSSGSGFYHHKYVVADSAVLAVGSMNWTKRGEKTNAENVVILHDRRLAKLFREGKG